ncbi:winged helix-turn-helix domain-containing protein [Flaviflexus huanghaiensis]|uniref:winged helix-turn-helix domain-containing protein n=1 Tax=Flaviflexus huanghaiensis TaxID=1111473 RepID=UPI0015FB0ECE|nr:crosslink repair DNA glycosylase YcaQ family protein [Flaviflexus huanghaiensis]
MRRLSQQQARGLAIRAQHLERISPASTRADVASMVKKMGVLQIDTVNVLVRAHYFPLYSRLGPYETTLLDDAASKPPRLVFEQWGHEACFVPPATHRLLSGFRRRWSGGNIEAHPGADWLAQRITDYLKTRTATAPQVSAWLGTQDLTPEEADLIEQRTGFDWSRNAVKVMLENLFDRDILASAGRTHHFHRIYGARTRMLPNTAGDPPDLQTALTALTKLSLTKVGIGTAATIADFFRLPMTSVRPVLNALIDSGQAVPVEVDGMKDAVMDGSASIPRAVRGTTFLSPFDPLIFERRRALALFGLDYRIGIYTPAPQRTRGYYSLPLLHNGTIPARADLALDRQSSRLLVAGAWYEPNGESPETDRALAGEIERLAGWLGATSIAVTDGLGDAMSELRTRL